MMRLNGKHPGGAPKCYPNHKLSKYIMGAVAERRVLRLLASAKVHRLGPLRLEGLRALIGARMRAVAEGLLLRAPAGAPEVGFSRFDLDEVGVHICNKAVVRHRCILLVAVFERRLNPEMDRAQGSCPRA